MSFFLKAGARAIGRLFQAAGSATLKARSANGNITHRDFSEAVMARVGNRSAKQLAESPKNTVRRATPTGGARGYAYCQIIQHRGGGCIRLAGGRRLSYGHVISSSFIFPLARPWAYDIHVHTDTASVAFRPLYGASDVQSA